MEAIQSNRDNALKYKEGKQWLSDYLLLEVDGGAALWNQDKAVFYTFVDEAVDQSWGRTDGNCDENQVREFLVYWVAAIRNRKKAGLPVV